METRKTPSITSSPAKTPAGAHTPRSLRKTVGVIIAVAVVAAFAWYYVWAAEMPAMPGMGQPAAPAAKSAPGASQGATKEGEKVQWWTCSMHPEIRLPHPGKCPICFMNLIPVLQEAKPSASTEAALVLSPEARKLAEVETSLVTYRPLSVTVRMVGKIEYDQMRLAYVSAWVAGRIDKLYVNFIGESVKKGDHLMYFYSPDVKIAQEEYLISKRRFDAAKGAGDSGEIASATALKDAGRKKLELWGILPAQIDELEKTGKSDDHITIYAPAGGTVVERDAFEGKYVQTGERLLSIADLGVVWAVLDAYEMDLPWVRYGQSLQFETETFPGEVFSGRVSFVEPFVNDANRTVKVRVNIPNPGERLKIGMFMQGKLDVTLAEDGKPMEPSLAGKWICSMHPEIVKDAPGKCDICGMDLVTAESLGFAKPDQRVKKVLSVPDTAPLLTGTRAIVYVEEGSGDETSYVLREVTLGPRAGNYYVVLSGLSDGERVVTRGSFKIDSARQIQGMPSMMSPGGGPAPMAGMEGMSMPGTEMPATTPPASAAAPVAKETPGVKGMPGMETPAAPAPAKAPAPKEMPPMKGMPGMDPPAPASTTTKPEAAAKLSAPVEFQVSLGKVLDAYLDIHKALISDDFSAAVKATAALKDKVDKVDMSPLMGDSMTSWMKTLKSLGDTLKKMSEAKDIEALRTPFADLSTEVADAVRTFGISPKVAVYRLHCPMSLNGKGADWLQKDKKTQNPYLGKQMPTCGSVVETIGDDKKAGGSND